LVAQTTQTHSRSNMDFVYVAPNLGGYPQNPNFCGVNKRFLAQRAKY